MGSLHQDAAWDRYPGVCDQGKGQLQLKIEIQFPLKNFSMFWPIDPKLAAWVAYTKDAAWDCYPGVFDQGQCHCY